MKTIIGVMGPGSGASPQDCQRAFELGQHIAKEGWVLLTGGRNQGVMDSASQGAHQGGGMVIGVLPGSDRSSMSTAVDIPIITGMGHARNVINVLSSQVVIACGVGLGTSSEVALALKSGVPVILLNDDKRSETFFKRAAGIENNSRTLSRVETPEAAIALVLQYLKDKP